MDSTLHTLLVCDLDGTLMPAVPGFDAAHAAAVGELRELLVSDAGLSLACATGRSLDAALIGLQERCLPMPDLICCDVGTSVYARTDGSWRRDDAHEANMSAAAGGRGATDWSDLLAGIPGLIPQIAVHQSRWKASYHLPDGTAGDAILAEAARRLSAAGTSPSLVRSRGIRDEGSLLDVLPPGVTKAVGVQRMASLRGLSPAQVVYAGDSGNDTDALLAAGRAIVVANAPAALKKLLWGSGEQCRENVFVASLSHLPGVLEGCRHFGLMAGS